MEHILVIIIVGLAVAGFVRNVFMTYRDGGCGCGCNGCSQADGCSDISRRYPDTYSFCEDISLKGKDN